MKFYENLENMLQHYTKTGGFLTVSNEGKVNTMTVSWGYIGYFWAKPVFVVGVRPQRHTYNIIENGTEFTISVPIEKLKDELILCGTKSGKHIDKSTVLQYSDAQKVKTPIVLGCDYYYECSIKYKSNINRNILDNSINEAIYPSSDHHTLYFGEILDCYQK